MLRDARRQAVRTALVGDGVTGDLWLSLIALDVRHSRTRPALIDPQVRYRIVLDGFPGATCRQQAGVLYLYTASTSGQPPRLLVQSTTKPDWSFLPTRHGASISQVQDIGPFWDRIRAGSLYRFWLTACPSRAVGGHGGNRIRGTRTAIGDPSEGDWTAQRPSPTSRSPVPQRRPHAEASTRSPSPRRRSAGH